MTPWTRGYNAGTEDAARSQAWRAAGRPGSPKGGTNCPYDSGPGFGPWISGYTAGVADAVKADQVAAPSDQVAA